MKDVHKQYNSVSGFILAPFIVVGAGILKGFVQANMHVIDIIVESVVTIAVGYIVYFHKLLWIITPILAVVPILMVLIWFMSMLYCKYRSMLALVANDDDTASVDSRTSIKCRPSAAQLLDSRARIFSSTKGAARSPNQNGVTFNGWMGTMTRTNGEGSGTNKTGNGSIDSGDRNSKTAVVPTTNSTGMALDVVGPLPSRYIPEAPDSNSDWIEYDINNDFITYLNGEPINLPAFPAPDEISTWSKWEE